MLGAGGEAACRRGYVRRLGRAIQQSQRWLPLGRLPSVKGSKQLTVAAPEARSAVNALARRFLLSSSCRRNRRS